MRPPYGPSFGFALSLFALAPVARGQCPNWSQALGAAGANGNVLALVRDDAAGATRLFAGGEFSSIGGASAQHVALWDGAQWSALGAGTDGLVRALVFLDDGTGRKLYAAGSFAHAGGVLVNGVARWDGTSWSALTSAAGSLLGEVRTIAVHDDGFGARLYAGGNILLAGGVATNNVAVWVGASWYPVGSGLDNTVEALTSYDDGTGAQLVAGGALLLSARGVARWNGSVWSPLAGGLNDAVYALCAHDEGSGPLLFAGGVFSSAVGGGAAAGIARWDGVSWSALGSGVHGGTYPENGVRALCSLETNVLAVGGGFTQAGAGAASRVALWSSGSWSAAGSGTDGRVRALASVAGPVGARLVAGGEFLLAGGASAPHLALREHCPSYVATCFGDGTLGACPCANAGANGHGCASSTNPEGALLVPSGGTEPDTLSLACSSMFPTSPSVLIQGTQPIAPSVFGDGLRCAGGTLRRLFVHPANIGNTVFPGVGDPSITQRSAAKGDVLAPGVLRAYFVHYRDASAAWCPPPQGSTWNASNGVVVSW